MRLTDAIVVLAFVTAPGLAAAQDLAAGDPPAPAPEHRLSPEQVEAILAEAAAKREAVERQPALDEAKAPAPQVHGEVGFTVGTGGYREAFGTAVYPLGEDGVAVISLDLVNWGNRRFRY